MLNCPICGGDVVSIEKDPGYKRFNFFRCLKSNNIVQDFRFDKYYLHFMKEAIEIDNYVYIVKDTYLSFNKGDRFDIYRHFVQNGDLFRDYSTDKITVFIDKFSHISQTRLETIINFS